MSSENCKNENDNDNKNENNKVTHNELQMEFLALVEKMKASSCPLPDTLELSYTVEEHSDRHNRGIIITPFLTRPVISDEDNPSQKWVGKYGKRIDFEVRDSSDTVLLDDDVLDTIHPYQTTYEISSW